MEAALKAIGELPAGQQIPMLLETLVESQKAVKELQAKVQQLGTVEPETAEERNVSGTQQLIAKEVIICSLYPPGRVLCHSSTKQVRQSTLSGGYFTSVAEYSV